MDNLVRKILKRVKNELEISGFLLVITGLFLNVHTHGELGTKSIELISFLLLSSTCVVLVHIIDKVFRELYAYIGLTIMKKSREGEMTSEEVGSLMIKE